MESAAVPSLSALDLTKSFGPTRALQGASIHLQAGEIHALLGENGSGKSTFVKILTGIHRADHGSIRRDGRTVTVANPAAARALGIGIVLQELSLAPALSVVDNLFLGREQSIGVPGLLDRRAQINKCRGVLNRLELSLDPHRPVHSLSIAQKQMLEIAKALLQDPAILIFDEPTASLAAREVAQLFRVIEQLRGRGVAILYVTHHLREVLTIADRVSLMREGRIAAELKVADDTSEDTLIGLLTKKRLGDASAKSSRRSAALLLRVSELKTPSCNSVSFHVHSGEIVGLYGVMGCGREEIARSLVGLQRRQGGDIQLNERSYHAAGPAGALAQGVGFLPADRKQEGILPNRPIRENLTLASLTKYARLGVLRQRAERNETADYLASLRVVHGSPEDAISTLSGGNQQKVLFGRLLLAGPKILVLEDPTCGIDIGAKYDLYELIRRAANEGTSFIWLSSDLTETLTICDRVYALHRGAIVAELTAPSLADEGVLTAAVLGRGKSAAA